MTYCRGAARAFDCCSLPIISQVRAALKADEGSHGSGLDLSRAATTPGLAPTPHVEAWPPLGPWQLESKIFLG